jgi:hypothetical protein
MFLPIGTEAQTRPATERLKYLFGHFCPVRATSLVCKCGNSNNLEGTLCICCSKTWPTSVSMPLCQGGVPAYRWDDTGSAEFAMTGRA